MLQVTVKRSQWLRGEGGDASFLLRLSDSRMCCLGFACVAAGVPRDALGSVATPYGLDVHMVPEFARGSDAVGSLDDLMSVNDVRLVGENPDVKFHTDPPRPITSEADREALLTELGLKVGLAFTFED